MKIYIKSKTLQFAWSIAEQYMNELSDWICIAKPYAVFMQYAKQPPGKILSAPIVQTFLSTSEIVDMIHSVVTVNQRKQNEKQNQTLSSSLAQ